MLKDCDRSFVTIELAIEKGAAAMVKECPLPRHSKVCFLIARVALPSRLCGLVESTLRGIRASPHLTFALVLLLLAIHQLLCKSKLQNMRPAYSSLTPPLTFFAARSSPSHVIFPFPSLHTRLCLRSPTHGKLRKAGHLETYACHLL